MFANGVCKLMDFGLAINLHHARPVSRVGRARATAAAAPRLASLPLRCDPPHSRRTAAAAAATAGLRSTCRLRW